MIERQNPTDDSDDGEDNGPESEDETTSGVKSLGGLSSSVSF